MLKLKAILWTLAFLMKRKARKSEKIQSIIKDKTVRFIIQTDDMSVVRSYVIDQSAISSASRALDQPTFTLSFKDAACATRILLDKDKNAVMRAIQDKELVIHGDFGEVLWFQSFIGHVLK